MTPDRRPSLDGRSAKVNTATARFLAQFTRRFPALRANPFALRPEIASDAIQATWNIGTDNSVQSALTHLGEAGASLLLLMAKSRHKKPENLRRYFKPSSEAIAEVTSLLAPGDSRR